MTAAETTKWARTEAEKDLRYAERKYNQALRENDQEALAEAEKTLNQARQVHKVVNGFEGHAAAARYGEQRIAREEEDEPEEKPKEKEPSRYSSGLSSTFYRDIGAMLTGRPVGNVYDIYANEAKQLMHQKNNESAREDMESQDAWQRGSRNEYAEAGKEASFKNDAMNRQRMNQTAFTGSNRGRMRELTEPDVRHWQQYGAQQRQLGQQRADAADTDREGAITANATSQEGQIDSRDYDKDLNDSWRLSMGYGYGPDRQKQTSTTQYTPPPVRQKEPEPEPEPTQYAEASPQKVWNYMTYGADKSSQQYNGAGMDDDAWALWKEWGSPAPLTPEEAAQVGGFGNGMEQEPALRKLLEQKYPDVYDKFKQAESARNLGTDNERHLGDGLSEEELRGYRTSVGGTPQQQGQAGRTVIQGIQGRNGMPSNIPARGYACGTSNAKPGLAWVGENGPELVNFNGGEQVYPTDYQGFLNEVCDERCKRIKARVDNGEGLSRDDFLFLADMAGDYDGFNLYDHQDDTDVSDDILDGYAEHIRNYLYNYKPGTESIDPRIDPNEEHIGPMAQDIEQVNPACVKELPNGVKTVDTGRLAMMNAGVIGDIVRRLGALEQMIGAR